MMEKIYIGNTKWIELDTNAEDKQFFSVQGRTAKIANGTLVFELEAKDDRVKIRTLQLPETWNGDRVYVIDVHCDLAQKFGEAPNHFGGLTIYRHLLKLYDRHPENLKVVFYSPIDQDALVEISQGEHYVLRLLPFVQWKPDPKFEVALDQQIQKYEKEAWPQFVVASENLLSGWAAQRWSAEQRCFRKIQIPAEHKILIVDDQMAAWRKTYRAIIENFPTGFIDNDFGLQEEFMRDWEVKVKPEILRLVKEENATAVISDFYLEQHHEDSKPFKTRKELDDISGFRLLCEIKKDFPFLPYMMFTVSNKVWNYEVFQSNGIWNWSVKNVEPNAKLDDKIQQFDHFESNVKALLNEDWSDIRELWIRFQKLQEIWTSKWWVKIFADPKSPLQSITHLPPPTTSSQDVLQDYLSACLKAQEIVELLCDQFYLLSRDFGSKRDFESLNFASVDALVYSSVVVNIGGMVEKLQMKNEVVGFFNVISSFLSLIRAYYAHGTYFKDAKRSDAILAIACIVKILETSNRSELPTVTYALNEQITMKLKPKLNYLYYTAFSIVLKNGDLCRIGRKHLRCLIATAQNDKDGIKGIDFQGLHNRFVLNSGERGKRKKDVPRTNFGKELIKKAAVVLNVIVK